MHQVDKKGVVRVYRDIQRRMEECHGREARVHLACCLWVMEEEWPWLKG